MNTARNLLRYAIGDILKVCPPDCFTYTTSASFPLTEPNIDSTTIVVYKNGSVYSASNYTYSSTTGRITISGLTAGDALEIYYSAYRKYSDTELNGYIRNALSWISSLQYKDFSVGSGDVILDSDEVSPTVKEYNLIALVATVLIDGRIKSYKTNEITIQFSNNESIDIRIAKLVEAHRAIELSADYHNLDYDNSDD